MQTVKIEIHYCAEWNYEPEAASLAEELVNALDVKAKLVPGHNGIFDIIADGKLIFSKFQAGRFPETGEVVAKLKQWNPVNTSKDKGKHVSVLN